MPFRAMLRERCPYCNGSVVSSLPCRSLCRTEAKNVDGDSQLGIPTQSIGKKIPTRGVGAIGFHSEPARGVRSYVVLRAKKHSSLGNDRRPGPTGVIDPEVGSPIRVPPE